VRNDTSVGAGVTFDLKANEATGRPEIASDVRCWALWGANGHLDRWYDVLEVWRAWADDAQGQALDCGHYLPEEAPEATLEVLTPFLARVGVC
jgi:haloacetate dehalogenase